MVLAVVETCRLQARNVFHFVAKAVDAHLHQKPAPTLLGV
jgi:hypothetical protein